MKTLFTITSLLALIIFMLMPSQSFAQSGTLDVYANGPTLDKVINGDVTNGVQNHKVYQLVSLDTTYLLDATITTKSGISIIGVPDPSTGKLPCIEADVLQDLSIPGIFFTFTGQGTRVVLQNLYLLGIASFRDISEDDDGSRDPAVVILYRGPACIHRHPFAVLALDHGRSADD